MHSFTLHGNVEGHRLGNSALGEEGLINIPVVLGLQGHLGYPSVLPLTYDSPGIFARPSRDAFEEVCRETAHMSIRRWLARGELHTV